MFETNNAIESCFEIKEIIFKTNLVFLFIFHFVKFWAKCSYCFQKLIFFIVTPQSDLKLYLCSYYGRDFSCWFGIFQIVLYFHNLNKSEEPTPTIHVKNIKMISFNYKKICFWYNVINCTVWTAYSNNFVSTVYVIIQTL